MEFISWRSHETSGKITLNFLRDLDDAISNTKSIIPDTRSFCMGLIMIDKDGFITGLEAGGCLGTSNHDLIIFTISKQRTGQS